MQKIDPRSPGKSTDSDQFKDPHDQLGSMADSGHEGLSRDSGGSFSNKSMSRGGESPEGDEYVRKYRPRGGGRDESDVPSGANLNDEGTGYDKSDVDDGATVNRNIVKQP